MISRAEWPSDRESFSILDRNRDGMLTAYEYLDARGLQERFGLLDDNGDGGARSPGMERNGGDLPGPRPQPRRAGEPRRIRELKGE